MAVEKWQCLIHSSIVLVVEATHHVYYYYALNESHTLPYQIPGRIARPHPPPSRIWPGYSQHL